MNDTNITPNSKLSTDKRILAGVFAVIFSVVILLMIRSSLISGSEIFEASLPYVFSAMFVLFFLGQAFWGHIPESNRRIHFAMWGALILCIIGSLFTMAFTSSMIFSKTIFPTNALGPIIGHYTFFSNLGLILGAVGGYIYARLHPGKPIPFSSYGKITLK